jgi:2-polyprenyl-3-methyl-5-hydroxy-6-metoxy-1,4-benzoquinol methylase
MGLFSWGKKLLKKVLRKIGYEVRPLNILRANNAVDYNTEASLDRFYSNRRLTEKYRREGVRQHLKNLRTVLREERFEVRSDMVILDAGCGTGDCLRMLQEEYGCTQLTGADISASVLAIARDICAKAQFYQADLMTRPLPGEFDLILCQQVLEHMVRPEDALRNLLGMLRPRGTILITVPDGRLDDFAGHIHFWSRDSLPIFLQKELPGCRIRTGALQDGVSLYAVIGQTN